MQLKRLLHHFNTGLWGELTPLNRLSTIAKTLSNELAPFGISVNNVLPGATRTERLEEIIVGGAAKKGTSIESVEKDMKREIPMARFAEAQEVAAMVAFLASPAAAYITGVSIPVDGGRIKGL